MNIKKQLLIILFGLLGLSSLAQTNKKTLNYQAVILDPKAIDIPGANITGQPLNKGNVCLRFSLLNAQGGLDYEETQSLTTDEYGLVNVAIGSGTQAQAGNSTSIYKSFESVVWNSSIKSLKVSVSYDGCSSFKQVSAQALNYTPYALYAEAVDYKNVREAPKKLSQFSNDAGFLIPKDLDPLKADIKTNTSQLAMANQTIVDNKKSSDATFLLVNQSITSLDTKVAENTSSITNINTKITDQQNQISDNRNQITATNNNLNTQIGGLQGQLNTTNSTVNSLSGVAEVVSNKSTAVDLGGTNPSDQSYPSQKAAKAYVDQVVSQIATTGVPDATTLAAGKLQLAGDLGGTATSPTVPALTNKENSSNKSTNVQTDAASDTKYPSVKAVKDYVDQATMGTALQATVDGKADKLSPTFTGAPTAPTQTSGDNSTKLATTAYVDAQVSAGAVDASTSTKGIIKLTGDLGGTAASPTVPGLALKADIASPTFTGTPALPTGTTGVTQTAGDNSTKLATTAYVTTAVSGNSGVPYSGATAAVNLGAYDLTINGLTVGRGRSGIASNTAIGNLSLSSNTTGNDNTATGNLSLGSNTTGRENIAYGFLSLLSNTTGSGNTANGANSMLRNTTGGGNTANGAYSLSGNSTGNNNTANGTLSLNDNSSGSGNTAYGLYSMRHNTWGNNNAALGANAGAQNITGNENTLIGHSADVSSNNLSNATALGNGALVAASNTIQLGNTSVTNVKTSGTITAGSVTYPSAHGTANQVLSTTGSGTLTWITPSTGGGGGSGTYTTGLNASLGGYVFFITPDGKHGLVAAGQDQGSGSWYAGNQDKISNPSNHDANGKNFTDWRMPSRYELNLMFLDRTNIGLLGGSAIYWSSTENDSGGQFGQGLSYPSFAINKANPGYYFRAIRSF